MHPPSISSKKLLVLVIASVASAATSMAEGGRLSGDAQAPLASVSPAQVSVTQHVRVLANSEAMPQELFDEAFIALDYTLSGEIGLATNCDNAVRIRLVPDNPLLDIQESFETLPQTGAIYWYGLFGQCEADTPCEDGFTVEFEWLDSACEAFSSANIEWSIDASIQYNVDTEISALADLEVEFE